MAAECPAAARSDGGVNRAINQVIMTTVIMSSIILRIIVNMNREKRNLDQNFSHMKLLSIFKQ